MKRYELPEYQRHLGTAMGKLAAAEAAMVGLAEQFMELCRLGVEDGIAFGREDDYRLVMAGIEVGRLVWHTVEGILFHTSGSAGARNGQRMQRYFRDLATYWSHNSPAQEQVLAERLGRLRLGLPLPTVRRAPGRRVKCHLCADSHPNSRSVVELTHCTRRSNHEPV